MLPVKFNMKPGEVLIEDPDFKDCGISCDEDPVTKELTNKTWLWFHSHKLNGIILVGPKTDDELRKQFTYVLANLVPSELRELDDLIDEMARDADFDIEGETDFDDLFESYEDSIYDLIVSLVEQKKAKLKGEDDDHKEN